MSRSLPSERLAAAAADIDGVRAAVLSFAMAAGALQCVAAMLPDGESHVVHFNGRWAHLGSHSVRRILDLADQALDMGRCFGCQPAPIGAGGPDKPERCPECGTTTYRHSPECGASWSPDYRREPAPPKVPSEPGKPHAPEKPDTAFAAIEAEISRLIGAA